MPYRRDGKNYYRVTEVLSSLECENIAYQIKHGDPKRPRESHAVVIPGTFLHYRIAKFLCEEADIEPPPVPVFNDGLQKIIDTWRDNGSIDEKLHIPVKEGFENFLHFWNAYDLTPVAIEQTMFHSFEYGGKHYDLGGTVDLVARVKLKGTLFRDGKHLLFDRCKHVDPDPLCQCEWHEVVTVMDWKFSLRPHKNHPIQLSIYRWMAEELGLMERWTHDYKYPANAENWSVLLKTRNGNVDHQLWKYQQDTEDFFEGCRILDNPRPRTINARTGHEGVKMRCSFCAERWNCPDIGVWTPKINYDDAVVIEDEPD
jgi:hypothetical protein